MTEPRVRTRQIACATPGALRGLTTLLIATLIGCGGQGDLPTLGKVSGVVTLDGVPLSNAAVTFAPEGFRNSSGITNSEGRYELTYLRDIKGAVVGEHRVHIVVVPGDSASINSLPPRYGTKTELAATVERGSNSFNWELDSTP